MNISLRQNFLSNRSDVLNGPCNIREKNPIIIIVCQMLRMFLIRKNILIIGS